MRKANLECTNFKGMSWESWDLEISLDLEPDVLQIRTGRADRKHGVVRSRIRKHSVVRSGTSRNWRERRLEQTSLQGEV